MRERQCCEGENSHLGDGKGNDSYSESQLVVLYGTSVASSLGQIAALEIKRYRRQTNQSGI